MTAYSLDTSFRVAHEVSRHAFHRPVRGCCDKLLTRGDRLALAPQALAEFIQEWNQHFDHGIERFVVFVTAATF